MERPVFPNFPQQELSAMAHSIARHTRFVFFSKHILLLLVLLLAGGVVFLPLFSQEDAGIRIAFSNVEKAGNAIVPRMLKPRLQGVDSSNQPFLVTAEEGVQPEEGQVELHQIKADMMLDGQSWLMLTARRAEVDMLNKRMMLEGEIALFHNSGYELHTEKAYVDMDKSVAYGDAEVTGQGPAGILKSGGFRVYDRGERLQFNNGVHLTIYPKKAG